MQQFHKIIDLTIKHAYYRDGILPGTTLQPTADTKATIQQLGVIIKLIPTGLMMAVSNQKASTLGDEGAVFEFELYVANPLFYQITDLQNDDWAGKALLFDKTLASSQDGAVTLLHQEGQAGKSNVVEAESLEGFNPSSIGLVRLHIDAASLIPDSDGNIPSKQYEIRFETRAVKWRYFLISDQLDESYSMVITHPQSSFSAFEKKQLVTGQGAWCSTSENTIPLHDQFTGQVSLDIQKDDMPALGTPISLPNVSAESIKGEAMPDGSVELFADMYVYL